MTTKEIILWILIVLIVSATVLILVCGCTGGGVAYYTSEPEVSLGNYDAASLPPSYVPQNVWVRHMGQPDQLVQLMPAY